MKTYARHALISLSGSMMGIWRRFLLIWNKSMEVEMMEEDEYFESEEEYVEDD